MDHTTPDNLSKPPREVPPLSPWECEVIRENIIKFMCYGASISPILPMEFMVDRFFQGNINSAEYFMTCEAASRRGAYCIRGILPCLGPVGASFLYIPVEFAREGIEIIQELRWPEEFIENVKDFFGIEGGK